MKVSSIAALGTAAAAGLATASPSRPRVGLQNIKPLGKPTLSGRSMQGAGFDDNFPDPSMIADGDTWYAYSTSSDGKGIPIATSGDAISWTLTDDDALPDAGSWINPDDTGIWAPDVIRNDNGTYVMYYVGAVVDSGRCIGVATSTSPTGPFVPASDEPLLCDIDGGGVIDPAGYDDGTDRWLLWKVDGNSLGGATTCTGNPGGDEYMSTPIKIQKMTRDGLTLLDEPSTILDNEGASNDGVVEAPALYKVPDGDYLLFYSAHCYSSDDYDVEYAWSSTINGEYGDRGVLFRTADNIGVYGPGHPEIDTNGINMLFHGRQNPNDGGASRTLYSAEISIDGRSITY